MTFGNILWNQVNSGLINSNNHSKDNGFFADTVKEFILGLKERDYEPLGICKNVPFPCSTTEHSIAFVYKYEEEIYWCHMPETYWFHLLNELYGRDKASELFDRILF